MNDSDYFVAQSTFRSFKNMKEQEIKETLTDIRDMMERSQKVMFLNGTSGVVVAVWALLGAVLVSKLMYGSISPLWGSTAFPLRDMESGLFAITAIVFAGTFLAAWITAWLMSKNRAKRLGLEFRLDTSAKQLLHSLFTVMSIGGLFCLTPIGSRFYAGFLRACTCGHFTYGIQNIHHQILRFFTDSSRIGRTRIAPVLYDVLDHRILHTSFYLGCMVPLCI